MKTIKIKDYYGKYQSVPVSDDLYEEWRKLQNETQRVYRREMYHRSGHSLEEVDSVAQRDWDFSLDELLIQAEENAALYAAITRLTPVQRRRIQMLLDDMSLRDMSQQEKCHYNCVWESVHRALRRIRQYLDDSAALR